MIDYVLLEKYAQEVSVLFVEDDETIRKEVNDLLSDIFSYVDIAVDGEDGIHQYQEYYKKHEKYYDLVITDIKMPKKNGIELCKLIFNIQPEQPLIVLSAHDESPYLIELINMGISQFIQKPLEINNFIQVIFNLSQDIYNKKMQTEPEDTTTVYLADELVWDKCLKKLTLKDVPIKLSKKELLILECLLQVKDKVCTVDELLNFVWNDDDNSSPDVQNLNNILARLRKKIPLLHLENIYGLGYKIHRN